MSGQLLAHACVKGKELRFRTADGTKLAAHTFGSGETPVLAHGNGSNRPSRVVSRTGPHV